MGMVVRTNVMANNAFRQLGMNNSQVSKSLEKLASGYRINRAGDDAAGLAVSEGMKAQIKGLESASSNSQDGISLVQTAEGALNEVHDMLNRMVELSTKAANGTYTDAQRAQYQAEVEHLTGEIDRIAETTEFNGLKILNGNLSDGVASASGTFGTANISISAGTKQFNGANDTSITFKVDSAKKAGVEVDFGANGAINITLGSQAAASYSTEEIEQAILAAAQRELANEQMDPANTNSNIGATETDIKNYIANLKGMNISIGGQPGNIYVKAGDDTTKVPDLALTLDTQGAGANGNLDLQVGTDGADPTNKISVNLKNMDSASLGIASLSVATQGTAQQAMEDAKKAIEMVSSHRADLGAIQNRLEHTINNLDTTQENLSAANSRIRDTDMAKEMMNYTKMNVLTQSAQAMLAQANQQPQAVLQLLQ